MKKELEKLYLDICNSHNFDCELGKIHYLYHYTSFETVKKILSQDGVFLRFTPIEEFSDKQEGKIIEDCYKTVVTELLEDGLITKKQYSELKDIAVFNKSLFITRENNGWLGTAKEEDVYVCCFSKEKDDQKMYKDYALDEEGPGYSIEFDGIALDQIKSKEILGHNYKIEIAEVLYGDDIISEIKSKIIELTENDAEVAQNTKTIIRIFLTNLAFSTKQKKYRYENEIRVIIKIPKNESPIDSKICEKRDGYVFLKLEEYVVSELLHSKNVSAEEDIIYKQQLPENYRKIILN